MTQVLEFLLGLDKIDLAEGGLIELRFLSAWPGWLAMLALLAAIVFIWAIYRRENPDAPLGGRIFLAVLRCLIVAIALAMIFEPALVLVRNNVVKSSVAVLVDGSDSMNINDGLATDPDETAAKALLTSGNVTPAERFRATRFELARALLQADQSAWLKKLAAEQRVYLYTFDGAPHAMAVLDSPDQVDEALRTLAEKSADKKWFGSKTEPVTCVEKVLDELAGQTVTGVAVISDWRGTVASKTDTLKEKLESRGIPIFPLGLGSTEPPKDLELRNVSVKRWAFVSEKPVIRVTVANQGLTGQEADLVLRVKGPSGEDSSLGQTVKVRLGQSGQPQDVEIKIEPKDPGTYELSLKLAPISGEFDEQNNEHLPIKLTVVDRKPKILMIEDLPRWEYQYLMTALYRDQTVLLSVLLHSAERNFAPEGSLPINRFPESLEALLEYDVIIIGDVDRKMFSVKEMEWIRDAVVKHDKAVIFIAGSRYNPNSYVYSDSPLQELLPIETSDETLTGNLTEGWRPELTIEGSVSPILKLEEEMASNEETWSKLEPLYWYYPARKAKPGAQVLLVHPSDHNAGAPDGKYPLMVLQRVGKGRAFFSATDDTWRWRKLTGRQYFNAFWLQLVRNLSLPQEDMTIDVGRMRYAFGDPTKIRLRLADAAALPDVETVDVTLSCDTGDPKESVADKTLTLHRTMTGSAIFEAEYPAEHVGKYTVKGDILGKNGAMKASGEFVVAPSREEFRQPTLDAKLMGSAAGFSKGSEVLRLATAPNRLSEIRDRNRLVPDDETDALWDSPLALGLFVLLIATEWILRKKYRML
jgi:uncharacterized membrane protein